ncbi:MAG TPA: recombinase RecT [Streptomyces sp.]
MSTKTTPLPAEPAPKPTEFSDAEHSMLDAMNVPTNRQGRALLFREMQRTGLDPFAKHLYLREDWNQKAGRNVYAVASTIDGFRIAAARQPTYEGQTAPQWCDKNGNWTDAWWVDAPPVAARIGVYVRGYREPMWGIARFSEYKPGGNAGFIWSKMAAHMIAKVAEALAIRKAYPDQLSGVYTDDEMQQADARKDEQAESRPSGRGKTQHRTGPADDEWNSVPPNVVAEQQDRDAEASQELPPPSPMVPTATREQLEQIAQLLKTKRGTVNGDRRAIVSQLVRRQVDDPRGLSQAEARSIIETLSAEPDHVPLPTVPATPEPAKAPEKPRPHQMKMMFALIRKKGHTKDGAYVLMSQVFHREITSANDLTPEEADQFIKLLDTGELPPGAATPEPAAPGPNSSGEGISEFDALDQMIWDVDSDEAFNEVQQAITVEVGRGSISATDAGILRERLAAHVKQAKAGV